MSNPTPPTILRNLYAKLEVMERELNESAGESPAMTYNKPIEEEQQRAPPPVSSPMSPLTLPSGNTAQGNVIDKFSKLSIGDQRSSSYSNPSNGSPQPRYQDQQDYARISMRSDNSKGRVSYSSTNNDKDTEYSSPKINCIRAAPTPPSINTYYNQNPKYMSQKSFPSEDETFNLESPYETDIPRYYGGSYPSQGYQSPQHYQSPPPFHSPPLMGSPGANSYAFSPDSTTFYNEVSLPNLDDYGNIVQDYKHQSDYSSKNEYYMPQRQSEYSKSSITNSFDLNADLEAHAKSFGAGNESMSESFSETKSFLAAVAEIDMSFDPSILKGKSPKYMKDLVNSNNFHKGGKLTISTSIFLNKKKTLFYALTTHRLYAFKEDRSDAQLISHYTIDKDAKVSKAGIYAGVRNFELTTIKDNGKNREIYEFECESKEEKEEWIHSISKVIQLHKYGEKTLPTLPQEKGYTSTLKTPNIPPAFPTPTMSPEFSPVNNTSFNAGNASFSSSYKSPTIQPNQYVPSIASQSSYSKVSPMYANSIPQNNGRRPSPQPLLVPKSPVGGRPMAKPHSSPNMNPIASPNFSYVKPSQKNLPINQLVNGPSPIPPRNPQQSPQVMNYYQRTSPMQRPQQGNWKWKN